MQIRRLALTGMMLFSLVSSLSYAAQPVIRISDACTMPSMPGKNSIQQDWKTYALLMKEYDDCIAAKATRYGEKTKEALESVGNAVINWKDTAAGWFD